MQKSLQTLDDHELIVLCQKQLPYNATGFEELVRRFQKKVFYLCKRYLSTESDAEDATQDVFMKVFHALPSFDHRSAFTTWLFSIAINHCKTLLGKKQLEAQRYEYGNEQATENFQDDSEDSEHDAELDDEKECIQGVLSRLKPEDRDLVLLRFTSELALDEIAGVMGKKLSATKMAFYRALEKFKELYQKLCV